MAISSLAARGAFRSGDAESPDPGPADPQPRHEGGDRRIHLGERLGGGLLRGRRWLARAPPSLAPAAAPAALTGLAPCLTRSPAVPPSAPGAQRPSSSAGRGRVAISPSRGTAAAGWARRPPPGSPLHELLPDHSTWRMTCLVVWRRLAPHGGLEGLTNIFIAWGTGSPLATAADKPQRSRPAPGRCREERLVLPGPLPSPCTQLFPPPSISCLGQGPVRLIPVNSHLPGREPNVPAADADSPTGFSWETTAPGLEGAGSRLPSPAGSVCPCKQLPGLKFFFLLLKSL